MLRAVLELAPGLFHYAHSVYTLCHQSFIGQIEPSSQQKVCNKGILWGLFSSALPFTACALNWCQNLNDGMLGGGMEDLRHDLEVVEQKGAEIGVTTVRRLKSILTSRIPSCSFSQEPVR